MRFKEFNPTLLEFVSPTGNDEISELLSVLNDPNEDPALKEKTSNLLTAMLQDLDQVEPTQPAPVSEAVSGNIVKQTLDSKDELLSLIRSNPKYSAAYDAIMMEKEKEIRQKIGVERKQGEQVVHDIVSRIVNNKFSVAQKESISAITSAIEGMIRSEEVGFKEMIEFLTACEKGGVINTGSMISNLGNEGSIPLTDKKYFHITQRILNISEIKVGNAQWGKGEVGLAFCGVDSRKEVSDISVGKTHIEVKAGAKKTDFFLKGTKGFKTQIPALEKLIDELNKVAKKYNMKMFNKTNKSGEGGIAQIGQRRLNGSPSMTGLNPYFKRMGKPAVEELLNSMLFQIHASNPKIVKKYVKEVKNSVNRDGTVDYHKLIVATAKLSFEYYEAMEGHDGLLLLNIPNFTFIYQPAGNTKEFGDLVDTNKIVPSSAIDFRSNSDGALSYFIDQ